MNKKILSYWFMLGCMFELLLPGDFGNRKKNNVDSPEEKRLSEEIHIKAGKKVVVAQVTDKTGQSDVVTHFNVDNNDLQINCIPKSGVGGIAFELDGIASLKIFELPKLPVMENQAGANLVLQTKEGTFVEALIKETTGIESVNLLNANMVFSGYRKGTKNKQVWLASAIHEIKILDSEQTSTGQDYVFKKNRPVKKMLVTEISLDKKIDEHEEAERRLEDNLETVEETSWFSGWFSKKPKKMEEVLFEALPPSVQQDYCLICLDDFEEHKDKLSFKTILKTPCKHYFHRKCLNKWMSRKKSCPVCRKLLEN